MNEFDYYCNVQRSTIRDYSSVSTSMVQDARNIPFFWVLSASEHTTYTTIIKTISLNLFAIFAFQIHLQFIIYRSDQPWFCCYSNWILLRITIIHIIQISKVGFRRHSWYTKAVAMSHVAPVGQYFIESRDRWRAFHVLFPKRIEWKPLTRTLNSTIHNIADFGRVKGPQLLDFYFK